MKNLKTFILLVVAFYSQNMLLIKFMSMFLRRSGVFMMILLITLEIIIY
jgi:hypothetical protein